MTTWRRIGRQKLYRRRRTAARDEESRLAADWDHASKAKHGQAGSEGLRSRETNSVGPATSHYFVRRQQGEGSNHASILGLKRQRSIILSYLD